MFSGNVSDCVCDFWNASNGRFPPRWVIDEHAEGFIVRDATGQALGCFYFEDEPGKRSVAKLLTRDEARRMAANFRQAAWSCCAGVRCSAAAMAFLNISGSAVPPRLRPDAA
jgi:hypothetical protein